MYGPGRVTPSLNCFNLMCLTKISLAGQHNGSPVICMQRGDGAAPCGQKKQGPFFLLSPRCSSHNGEEEEEEEGGVGGGEGEKQR